MIKAVFFDIDGTLLPQSSKEIPESTVKSLEKLRQKGIKVIIATGRNKMEMENLPLGVAKFDAYLTMNGQLTLDGNFNKIVGHPIHREEMEILKNIFEAKRIPFEMIGDSKRYINFINDMVVDIRSKTNGTVAEIGEYQGEDIYQINAFVDKKQKELLSSILDDCDITSWNDFGIDIISKGGGKSKGIKHYLIDNGLKQEEVMAFGDGENDIQMLQYAGIGVAMGNANYIVKLSANYVTDDSNKDGIEKALKHFKLID